MPHFHAICHINLDLATVHKQLLLWISPPSRIVDKRSTSDEAGYTLAAPNDRWLHPSFPILFHRRGERG